MKNFKAKYWSDPAKFRNRSNESYRRRAENVKIKMRQKYAGNSSKISNRIKIYQNNIKLEALRHYSPSGTEIKCSLCPETRLGALTLDHIGGGGKEHRLKIGTGKIIYFWVKKNNYPIGFRTLCANCNWKEHLRIMRLNQSQTAFAIRDRRYVQIVKLRFMAVFGSKCVICGIDDIDLLTVHHVNNNGAEHRKRVGNSGGRTFYLRVLKSGDFDGLECRCFSCNCCDAWS